MEESLKRWGVAAVAALAIGCGGREEPSAPAPLLPPPDLTGAMVLLLPVQSRTPAGLDPELAFWLSEVGARTEWVLPARLQALVDRSPAWRVQLDALPPGFAEVHGVRRVHDPLFGHLRRLGAMVGARLALVPIAAEVPAGDGTALELTGVLVDVVSGRVLWTGTVRGDAGAPGADPPAASAAEALARALAP